MKVKLIKHDFDGKCIYGRAVINNKIYILADSARRYLNPNKWSQLLRAIEKLRKTAIQFEERF